MIAYRSQYGSANPARIIAPALLATLISTLVAIAFCKWKDRREPPMKGRMEDETRAGGEAK
jgi:spore maturation protein A